MPPIQCDVVSAKQEFYQEIKAGKDDFKAKND